jgi:hypothetical protein
MAGCCECSRPPRWRPRPESIRIETSNYLAASRTNQIVRLVALLVSPGSAGRKLRSHANHNVRENGKNRNGNATQRTAPTISISVHGWLGALAIIQMIGTPIATTSPATRLKTYAPIQKSERSPRSNARPHCGHSSLSLSQLCKMNRPPHRGHRRHSARANFVATDELGATVATPSARRADDRGNRD